ncbi:MAG: hypothetical protein ACXWVD_00105 [Telluria sp.]
MSAKCINRDLHAAFIMEGLHEHNYNALLAKWDQGCIELVGSLMCYVPVIDAAMRTADALDMEYAGVFDYEVSARFGHWCGLRVLDTGALPPHNECVGYISGSARRFFQNGGATAAQLAAIRAAVEAFATGEGELP